MYIKVITLSVLISLSVLCINCTEHNPSIELADAAYDQFKLVKSRQILNAIVQNDTLKKDQKYLALTRLAFQDWKYFNNYNSAKKRLLEAVSVRESAFDGLMLLSRIEREYGNYNKALNTSLKAKKIARTKNEINAAHIAYAQTVFEIIVNAIENNQQYDKTLLNETIKLLSNILEHNAGMPKPSKLLLALALLNNDGENVLKAWKSYFHIQEIEETYPYLLTSAIKLKNICKEWNGKKLNINSEEKLIIALADSRFYEFIPVFVMASKNRKQYNQAVKDILSYALYLKEVKGKTDAYYRLIAVEKENEKEYKNWLSARKKQLWNSVSFLAKKKYSRENFISETERHFGARGFEGGTASYKGFNLCLGHIVNQESAIVKQYGYTPEFTYTEIDMMTSNTFPSWYWENKASGGWATENEIIRVREAYLKRPFLEWNTVTDSTTKKEIELLNKTFISSKGSSTLKEQKGLERKLNYDASTDLYKNLQNEGYKNTKLKLAFLNRFKHYRMEATILAHEGRHSIEKRYMLEQFSEWDNEEREFHAKLSQIIFATEPRYELAGMVADLNETGHGKANKRIVDIALNWVKKNSGKIKGYSESKSEFSQIYLLTNSQIKQLFKQVDPMNN